MPHQCTNCSRVFADGSKEMLSGCPECGGNKFQFRPDGPEPSVKSSGRPPETSPRPASNPPSDSSGTPTQSDSKDPSGPSPVARTVGKTAATVRGLMNSSDSAKPSIGADGNAPLESDGRIDSASSIDTTREDTAQASARSDFVSSDELPSEVTTETEHRFRPVRSDDESGTGDSPTPPDSEPESQPPSGTSTGDDTDSAESTAPDATERPDLDALRAELNDQFESIKVLNPGQYELNLMELYDREEYIIALQEDGKYSIQMPEHVRE